MNKNLKFFTISISAFLILIIAWFFTCFFLGFANNSDKYQLEIWIAFIITLIIHLIIILITHNKIYNKRIGFVLIITSILLYGIVALYFYYNS